MALLITFCVHKTGEFTLLGSKNFNSKCFAPGESHRVKTNEFNSKWIVKIIFHNLLAMAVPCEYLR